MINSYNFDAGKYYIGDLCYVIYDQWNEVCDIIIEGNYCKEGVFTLKDGHKFGIWGTAYGDGRYKDNIGNSYSVDSGQIGIILYSNINEKQKSNVDLGNVVDFATPFTVNCLNGVFNFGGLVINTNYEDE